MADAVLSGRLDQRLPEVPPHLTYSVRPGAQLQFERSYQVADATKSGLTEASFVPTGCLLESNLVTHMSKGACVQRSRLAEGGLSARSRGRGHAALAGHTFPICSLANELR